MMVTLTQITESNDLWKPFKAAVDKLGAHSQRIESPSTGFGVPDMECGYKSVQFWCELKIVRSGKIKFRRGQAEWVRRRWKAGCLSWVMARCRTRKLDEIYIWAGRDALKVEEHGMKVEPLYIFKINKRGSFNWEAILESMCVRVVWFSHE